MLGAVSDDPQPPLGWPSCLVVCGWTSTIGLHQSFQRWAGLSTAWLRVNHCSWPVGRQQRWSTLLHVAATPWPLATQALVPSLFPWLAAQRRSTSPAAASRRAGMGQPGHVSKRPACCSWHSSRAAWLRAGHQSVQARMREVPTRPFILMSSTGHCDTVRPIALHPAHHTVHGTAHSMLTPASWCARRPCAPYSQWRPSFDSLATAIQTRRAGTCGSLLHASALVVSPQLTFTLGEAAICYTVGDLSFFNFQWPRLSRLLLPIALQQAISSHEHL